MTERPTVVAEARAAGHRAGEAAASSRDWFGQPRGLTILCAVEMWEVFSMQGMRTLLVYYLTRQLQFAQGDASSVYGTYIAFAFLTPLLGGVLADRWLGRRNSVVLGGLIMAAGHFIMVWPDLLYLALGTLALGNGLYKPCLASQIKDLYGSDDARRDSAYSIFYAGKNAGALLAPLGCGTVGELFGWHWGFALAGVGMLIGLCVYLLGMRYLGEELTVAPADTGPLRPSHGDPAGMREYLRILVVGVAVVIFISAYEQLGNTFALWVDAGVNRSVGAWTIPMTWFQSLNPLCVFLFTPLLIWRWTRYKGQSDQSGSIRKMCGGAFVLSVGWLLLAAVAADASDDGETVAALWVVLFVVLYTIGELHVLPVGLGLFSQLAPAQLAATVLAIWYLTSFVGNFAAGQVGRLWSEMPPAAFFLMLSAVAAVAGLMLFALRSGPAAKPRGL